ncbi:MAG: NADPH-dependent 7-cyano-7-deazaguanine reductase QueF [Gammaproteobacteria bacterium]|nr:NADPH-dependent 7-cyano-7-deazaguanine reductase QueF [Gammaproteobacteria bacterium]MBQ0840454.1 NADPH-dependent 7-cyano-7-deazaguanine reductase QueF [Gammaproteobacteria bacterium]
MASDVNSSSNIAAAPLGKTLDYPSAYAPQLLFAIPRLAGRTELGLDSRSANTLPFAGQDLWTAYEISWCNLQGKPLVAVGEFTVACESPFIIESKSLKLYLNSLNQHRFASLPAARQTIADDLSRVAGAPVAVQLYSLDDYASKGLTVFAGQCLDDLDVECCVYQPDAELLAFSGAADDIVDESLYSHLMKSNCPVTGQPDWATMYVRYSGRPICHRSLLRYLVSFREHQGFHEHCVERVFLDIMQRCQPSRLVVSARYTRRGGLDINPTRTLGSETVDWARTGRQ